MQIPERTWRAYTQKLAKINQKAASLMSDYLEANGAGSMYKVIDYAYGLSGKYGEAAAELACEMYDAVAVAQKVAVAAAEPAEPASYDEVSRAVRKTAGNADVASSAVGRLVKQAGADTVLKNALRDGAEFAWIPSGDACAFCATLASRGWQRASKKTIKGGHAEHIHNNCQCEFAVRFDGKSDVEGYDPDKLYEEYIHADDGTPQDKINAMRRKRYAANKDTINAQKRAAYAKRHQKTGKLTPEEYAAYRQELKAASGKKQITLPKDEYAEVMSELNTNLTEEDRKHAVLVKHIGNYEYTIVNRGFNNYTVIKKETIQ